MSYAYVGNLNKAGVLASFSESTENINNVADIIANGIEYVPYDIFLDCGINKLEKRRVQDAYDLS